MEPTMARKSKYTPEMVAKFIEAIKMGATYELAAGYAGISESSLYEWLKQKPEFLEAVKSAEGTGAMIWLAKIEKAASEGNWQAAAWKLERRYPHLYGKQVIANQHSGEQTLRVIMDAAWRGEEQTVDHPVIEAAVNVAIDSAPDAPETTVTFVDTNEGDS
jgi:transposase